MDYFEFLEMHSGRRDEKEEIPGGFIPRLTYYIKSIYTNTDKKYLSLFFMLPMCLGLFIFLFGVIEIFFIMIGFVTLVCLIIAIFC